MGRILAVVLVAAGGAIGLLGVLWRAGDPLVRGAAAAVLAIGIGLNLAVAIGGRVRARPLVRVIGAIVGVAVTAGLWLTQWYVVAKLLPTVPEGGIAMRRGLAAWTSSLAVLSAACAYVTVTIVLLPVKPGRIARGPAARMASARDDES